MNHIPMSSTGADGAEPTPGAFHPDPTSVRAITTILGGVLLALALVYLNDVPDCRADQQDDSFCYIGLARSLLDGEGYPSKHWMPGFPVLLTGLIGRFGANWAVLKLAMIAMSILGVALSLRLFRPWIPPQAAVPLALILASTPIYFDYSHRVMSEIPALVSTTAALVAMNRVKSATGRKARLCWGVALAAGCVAAVLIRGNALALAPTLLVGIMAMRGPSARHARWALANALAWLLMAYGLWGLRAESRQYSGIHNVTYAQEVQAKDVAALWASSGEFGDGVERVDAAGLMRRIRENVMWHQIYRISGLMVPSADRLAGVEGTGIGLAIAAVLVVPPFIGLIRLSARSPELATFLLASMALVVVYPTGGAARMLLPFLPALLLAGYLGVDRLIGPRRAVGWLFCLLVANLVQCAVEADDQRRHPFSREGFGDFVGMITDELPKSLRRGDRVGSDLEVEFFAIRGERPRSVASVGEDVDAGRIGSALIVHAGGYTPGPRTRATTLARRGRVELLRVTHDDVEGGRSPDPSPMGNRAVP